MKVILSRKGFDSANGGQASPILPDGTMLSLPIPSHDDIPFSEIQWHGTSFCDIIRQLNKNTLIGSDSLCHLDPDLRKDVRPRRPGWPGAGTFRFDKRRVLTKEGCSRSRWTFPKAMWGTPISHCPNGWKEDFFQSAAIGQEFVMDATPAVMEWLKAIFNTEY